MKSIIVVAAGALIAAPIVAAQSGAYQQCGGLDYSGPTTCVSGYTCTYGNDCTINYPP